MNTIGRTAREFAVAAALVATLLAPARGARADADYQSPTEDRVRVSLGVMRVSNSTNLRLDPAATLDGGTYINAASALGLDGADIAVKFQAVLRVEERHRLFFDYFSLDRTGDSTIGAAPIVFHNVTLQPGDPAQSQLSLRMLGIAYGYSFWHNEKLEIAGTFGIEDTEVSAQVKVQSATRHVYDSENQAGPLPLPGIDATWSLSRRFYLDARAQYIDARVMGLTGSLGIYEFNALYRLRPNVSFAVGYQDLKAYVDKQEGAQTGRFDFSTKGPELFVRVAF